MVKNAFNILGKSLKNIIFNPVIPILYFGKNFTGFNF